jgi:hypothetical protein
MVTGTGTLRMLRAVMWLLLCLVGQIPTLTHATAPEPTPAVANDAAADAADATSAMDTCAYIDDDTGDCRTECTDLVDDVDECLQLASLGKCSVEGEESKALKRRCPKACRTCWSCDNVGGDDNCKGT